GVDRVRSPHRCCHGPEAGSTTETAALEQLLGDPRELSQLGLAQAVEEDLVQIGAVGLLGFLELPTTGFGDGHDHPPPVVVGPGPLHPAPPLQITDETRNATLT